MGRSIDPYRGHAGLSDHETRGVCVSCPHLALHLCGPRTPSALDKPSQLLAVVKKKLGPKCGTSESQETGFLCVALAALELSLYTRLASNSRDLPASASYMLELKVCATNHPAKEKLL